MADQPAAFVIEGTALERSTFDPKDPRGQLLMWEPPKRASTYIIGCDPTFGIENWNRSLRISDDVKTDNMAVEVIRLGHLDRGETDLQVAEYVAPIGYVQQARVLNTIGRLYSGSADDGLAPIIIEVYPGPGLMVQAELKEKYGYINLYQQPYIDTLVPQLRRNSPFGWYANRQTVRDLCLKGIYHITNNHVRINSADLIEELADCEPDPSTGIISAAPPRHDDRVRALFLALWAGHAWGSDLNIHETQTTTTNEPPWQASAISAEDMALRWSERVEEIIDDAY